MNEIYQFPLNKFLQYLKKCSLIMIRLKYKKFQRYSLYNKNSFLYLLFLVLLFLILLFALFVPRKMKNNNLISKKLQL